MRLDWRLGASSLLLAVSMLSPSAARGQEPGQEPVIILSVSPMTRAALYTALPPETSLYFTDEVIRLEVALNGTSGAKLAFKAGPAMWARGLRQQLRRNNQGVTLDVAAQLAAVPGQSRASLGRASGLFEIRGTDAQLPPGSYELSFEYDPNELADQASQPAAVLRLLRRTVKFEIREPSTNAEDLDRYLHRAYGATVAGNRPEARAWAERALALHPYSLFAMADIAEAWRVEGDCVKAAGYWNRAIEILMTNADSMLVNPIERPEELRSTWLAWSARCPK